MLEVFTHETWSKVRDIKRLLAHEFAIDVGESELVRMISDDAGNDWLWTVEMINEIHRSRRSMASLAQSIKDRQPRDPVLDWRRFASTVGVVGFMVLSWLSVIALALIVWRVLR